MQTISHPPPRRRPRCCSAPCSLQTAAGPRRPAHRPAGAQRPGRPPCAGLPGRHHTLAANPLCGPLVEANRQARAPGERHRRDRRRASPRRSPIDSPPRSTPSTSCRPPRLALANEGVRLSVDLGTLSTAAHALTHQGRHHRHAAAVRRHRHHGRPHRRDVRQDPDHVGQHRHSWPTASSPPSSCRTRTWRSPPSRSSPPRPTRWRLVAVAGGQPATNVSIASLITNGNLLASAHDRGGTQPGHHEQASWPRSPTDVRNFLTQVQGACALTIDGRGAQHHDHHRRRAWPSSTRPVADADRTRNRGRRLCGRHQRPPGDHLQLRRCTPRSRACCSCRPTSA
ncbi:MAG: hypothetical protein M0C28_17830 [Candidatus Moduliflexus flocculans]|nr:hypothetical protein [Candidatus Moduliflexus flocculans]